MSTSKKTSSTPKRKGSGRSEQRRQEIRRNIPRPSAEFRQLLRKPEVVRSACVLLVFLIFGTLLIGWGREQIRVYPGLIPGEAALTRLAYRLENEPATRVRRAEARDSSPYIYVPNTPALDRLKSSVLGLPTAVAATDSLADVADALKRDFALTDARLAAVRPFAGPGGPTDAWSRWTDSLVDTALITAPILDPETFQLFSTQAATNRALGLADGTFERPLRGEAMNVSSLNAEPIPPRLREIARRAGFPESIVDLVATRIALEGKPSLLLDRSRTNALREQAAESIEPVMIEHALGETIYRPGEPITDDQYAEALREGRMFNEHASWGARWLPRFGLLLLLLALAMALGAATALSHQKIARNPLRLVAISVLVLLMVGIGVLVSVDAPALTVAMAIGPLLLTTMVLRLAYDQRLAISVAAIQAAMITMAVDQSLSWFILLMAGAGTMVWQLQEVRSRACLIRASSMSAFVVVIAVVILAMLELPSPWAAALQILTDAAEAGVATLCVGFLVLGILPSVERLFHITTGMTLAELRDPRRPLLRELQQRAPGTYDHSLQVASIAEAAAESIGADGLLVYVGGLYHDIGKMHKPQYFVENQQGGENRHDNLSPAMSLLVIIGHVKDGMELAREYRIPREISHFIESHHGTTLVEYFYHAARQRAEEAGDKDTPSEVEFRYPGPRPRTREAAILMLADCVESATRAMSDPTPGQIEGLVHDLARKRLLDGQFDQTPITMAELAKVKEAILTRVCAIHHGRITYPEDVDASETAEVETAEAG